MGVAGNWRLGGSAKTRDSLLAGTCVQGHFQRNGRYQFITISRDASKSPRQPWPVTLDALLSGEDATLSRAVSHRYRSPRLACNYSDKLAGRSAINSAIRHLY